MIMVPMLWGGPPGSANEDGDRYIEIWNLVFMQYDRDQQQNLNPLPKPCVDTGMGLERIAAVIQGVHNNYDIDLFKSLIESIAADLKIEDTANQSLRVLADHLRSVSFLILDGVLPGNEGRAYVLRRILRRAIRHGYALGATGSFFYRYVPYLTAVMGEAYPDLRQQADKIAAHIKKEEEQFALTLNKGMALLEGIIAKAEHEIPGDMAFKLYDTYGFPVDLTADIAREHDLKVDLAGFEVEMAQQRLRSTKSSAFKSNVLPMPAGVQSQFVGYENDSAETEVIACFQENNATEDLLEGQQGALVLKQTPFYAESGGQVGDVGVINLKDGAACFVVQDTLYQGDVVVHFWILLHTGNKLIISIYRSNDHRG